MFSLKLGLTLVSMAAAVVIPLATHTPVAIDGGQPEYSKSQMEYYMSAEEIGYVRPGLNVTVNSLEINAESKIEMLLTFTDDMDQLLDMEGKVTPGPISVSFILAEWDEAKREFMAYTTRPQTSPITDVTEIQASSDSGGSWETLSMGVARYTFGTALPDGYNPAKTHSVAFYATRETTDIVGKRYYDNVVYDFRPDGNPVTDSWDAFTDETCNACHHTLGLHGGRRTNIKLCVTCHNIHVADPDTGNTIDMKVMIHKIHRGANLPSVEAGTPYQIIGHRQAVHDYSEVVAPFDIRNCAICHKPDSPEGDIWMTRPTRDACGSCHDDINWVTGEGHPLPQMDDTACASCHAPHGDTEFDISVVGAHMTEKDSAQLAGLNNEILEVTDLVPGGFPTVTFQVTNNDGTVVNPSDLSRLSILIGGPTTDYSFYIRGTATGATVVGDTAMYTFEDAIPEDATGTWAVSADTYRWVTLADGTDEGREFRECAFNPIFYVNIMNTEAPEARRDIVSLEKCNVCHDSLALHGGQRFAIEECVICHHPLEDDVSVRPEEELPAESVHFKYMIHRIHTGTELTNDYTVYGHGGSTHNYNHVGYPGDRRFCEACHISGTYGVPLPEGTLDTPTERDYYSPMKPAASACLSCHSSSDAAAHAYVNTAPFSEACAACHGDDRDHSVEKVHAR